MKDLKKSVLYGVLFYSVLFAVQCALFFIIPPFYVASPHQTQIPNFIKFSFGKYFGGILLLYLIWGGLLGLGNGLLLRLAGVSLGTVAKPRRLLLNLLGAQFLWLFLLVGFEYPSVLNQFPGIQLMPLWGIYLGMGGLAGLLLYIGCQSLVRRSPRSLSPILLAVVLPALSVLLFSRPSTLDLAEAPVGTVPDKAHMMVLGFDALDGDSGSRALEPFLSSEGGLLYRNAFTPIPLTHPAWNSILSGLYPAQHRVRFFFGSPYPPLYPESFLQKRLQRELGYITLFASDQPETSYFTAAEGFNKTLFNKIGWDAHLNAMMLNHFIFPGLWLNNAWVENMTGYRFNTPSIFNYDLRRFFNSTFEDYRHSVSGPRFLALHTCYLHTPIRLTRRELAALPDYWKLSPKQFNFTKWPKPGADKEKTPTGWVNPYHLRRAQLAAFLPEFLGQLKDKSYFQDHLIVFLSDHGERFVENYELYGGIHGVDLETREQNNVMLAFFGKPFRQFHSIEETVSLIDITPTLIHFAKLPLSHYPYDGEVLWDEAGLPLPVPKRPLFAESMGWIDDQEADNAFPQLSLKNLEESLTYFPDGQVVVSEEYYRRILNNKKFLDFSKSAEMRAGQASPIKAIGGAAL